MNVPAPEPTPAPTAPPASSGVLSKDGITPAQVREDNSWDRMKEQFPKQPI